MFEVIFVKFFRKISGVKIFSVLLVLAALGVFFNLLIPIVTLKKSLHKTQLESVKNHHNAFQNLSYSFQNEKGKVMQVQSKNLIQNEKNKFTMQNLTGNISLPDGNNAQLQAAKIIATTDGEKICELTGDVTISLNNGLSVNTEHAFVNLDKKISYGKSNVVINYRDMKMQAGEYQLSMVANLLKLEKNVHGNLMYEKFFTADNLTIVFLSKNIKHFHGASDATNIKQFIYEAQLFGNAKIESKNFEISAQNISCFQQQIEAHDNLSLIYVHANRKFFIKSQKIIAKLDKAGNIDNVQAIGNLEIKGDNFAVKANSGILKKHNVSLKGNVIISNEYGELFGDQAELNLETGDILINASSGVVQKI